MTWTRILWWRHADSPIASEALDWRQFAVARPEVLDEIIRQAELRLQAQLQSALAADSRAGLIASVQAATSAALAVLAGTHGTDPVPRAVAAISSALLAAGAAFAAWAARPIDFDIVGNYPGHWLDDLASENVIASKAATACHYDAHLRMNERRLRRNGRFVWWSLMLLTMTPIAALAIVGLKIEL